MKTRAAEKQRLADVFEEALGHRGAARQEYLARECISDPRFRAEDESLLAAHERGSAFMGGDSLPEPTELPDTSTGPAGPPHEQQGVTIGRYKLLERISEGGFGSVWMAEQHEPVRRRVALKILKQGMDSRAVTLKSLSRIVSAWACSSSVPASAVRRSVSTSTYAALDKSSRN